MKIKILTLFPGFFSGFLTESLLGQALEKNLLEVHIHNLRRFSQKKHLQVDDSPFGGGEGMLLCVEPVFEAFKKFAVVNEEGKKNPMGPLVIFPGPSGKPLSQNHLKKWAMEKELVVLCGHYEGIDARLYNWVDEEVSLGDYVLSGGEIPAMAICDGIARLIPGFMGNLESTRQDSFFKEAVLEHPQYTRPAHFLNYSVPSVLRGGNHGEITRWQRKMALQKTLENRPELLSGLPLEDWEIDWILKLKKGENPDG